MEISLKNKNGKKKKKQGRKRRDSNNSELVKPNDELVRRERGEGEPVREGEGMGERRFKIGKRM